MSYEVVLSPKARETLLGLDPPLQNALETHLDRLANSPTALSRPAVLPFPAGSQMYDFKHELDGRLYRFTVFFRYGADESTLHVIAIGHIPYADPPPLG